MATKNEQLQATAGTFSLVPRDFAEALEFGKLMAASDMVPKDYRGKPANVLVAVQMGAALGLNPMQSIQNIAVINGRPSLWGDALLAVVQAHKDFRGLTEKFNAEQMSSTCTVKRRGRDDVIRMFSRADAEKAGLWSKPGPWSQYPKRMLQVRARAWALRDSFADAIMGIRCAEEEQDVIDARTGEHTERPSVYVEAESMVNLQSAELEAETAIVEAEDRKKSKAERIAERLQSNMDGMMDE